MAASAHALAPGQELLEYRIDSLLASGPLGLTYVAHDTQMNARVAIREYLPINIAARGRDSAIEPLFPREGDLLRQAVARFVEESRRLASVRHPNVLRVARLFEANGTAYMVTEYEASTTLFEWRARSGRPTQAALARILLPALDGLHAMHEAGVLHRDLKPTRIRLRADGSPVILDFGAAHHIPSGRLRDTTLQVTVGYAPIEAYYTAGKRGPWSDLYSFAAIAYWAITGERPQEAPERLLANVLPALVATQDVSQFTPDFLAALDWALELDPDQRPRDAQILRRALAAGGMDVAEVARAKAGASSTEAQPAPPAAGATKPPAAGVIGSASPDFVPDPERLTALRDELARQLGPIANVVVKKALNEATGWRDLCHRAAMQIAGDAARQSFLERFSGAERPATGAYGASSTAAAPAARSGPDPTPASTAAFEPQMLAGLEAELAVYLGAIAKIVVRRCAGRARDKGELYEMIAAELDDPPRGRRFVAWAESRYGLR